MKKYTLIFLIVFCSGKTLIHAQEDNSGDTSYKKRVLETTEVDFLTSYYKQEGSHAAVSGGIGDEKLTDITPTIVVSIPLNDDDVLTIDAGISAYTSASSSNLDPFDATGASKTGSDGEPVGFTNPRGSPWVESSGASRQDVWGNINLTYSHSSDDRNKIWKASASFAAEYDYLSVGIGGGHTWLFNEKNTELDISAKVFLDKWNPKYPTELDSYLEVDGNLLNGFFSGVRILNENAEIIDKNGFGDAIWSPLKSVLVTNRNRNTYALSVGISQILSKNTQFSLFFDLVSQSGWLANPMQRVYFADRPNFYIGDGADIPFYTTKRNTEVFQLADDIERLPENRFKLPIGMRLNHYISETFSLRSYYRYYFDDWGVRAHTASLELPIKFGSGKYTLYPNYRYYDQTAADYFAPYETHLSTSEFYTSDYDLSDFNSHQYGLGFKYYDLFTKLKIFGFGLKTIDLRYGYYTRSDGLSSNIISAGFKFVLD